MAWRNGWRRKASSCWSRRSRPERARRVGDEPAVLRQSGPGLRADQAGLGKTQILLSNKVQRETPLGMLGVCVGPPPRRVRRTTRLEDLALRYSGIYYVHNEDSSELKPIEMEKFAARLRESMPTPDSFARRIPGLRPFEADEADLFFGREHHVDALLKRLSGSHFVAVVGESGAGKSSLVRAGLLPALEGGFVVEAGSDWRVA